MYKKIITFTILLFSIFMLSCVNVNALTLDNFYDNIYLLEDGSTKSSTSNSSSGITDPNDIGFLGDYNQEQTCDGDDSILGNVNDENSVAWLLQQILNYVKVIGPVLVVVLSSVDFVVVVVKGDDEAFAKAKKKLITRLILALLLFFIPVIVTAILDIFGITSSATCGIN